MGSGVSEEDGPSQPDIKETEKGGVGRFVLFLVHKLERMKGQVPVVSQLSQEVD